MGLKWFCIFLVIFLVSLSTAYHLSSNYEELYLKKSPEVKEAMANFINIINEYLRSEESFTSVQ